jgi:Skp family chaperone for outer membrane proteins
MTQRNIWFTLLVIVGVCIAFWLGGHLQNTIHNAEKRSQAPISIGIVDINKFKANSKVFQRFQNAMEDLNSTIHQEILSKETKLREEKELLEKEIKQHPQHNHKLEDSSPDPSREKIKKRKADFDKKVAELELNVRERRKELEQEYSRGFIKIKQTLKEIMEDLGKDYGLKIILNKSIGDESIVLYSGEELDLTDEVIKRLDKQLMSKKLHD